MKRQCEKSPDIMIPLLLVLVQMTYPTSGTAVFSLVRGHHVVSEGQQFEVGVEKTGIAASTVNVVVEVITL